MPYTKINKKGLYLSYKYITYHQLLQIVINIPNTALEKKKLEH